MKHPTTPNLALLCYQQKLTWTEVSGGSLMQLSSQALDDFITAEDLSLGLEEGLTTGQTGAALELDGWTKSGGKSVARSRSVFEDIFAALRSLISGNVNWLLMTFLFVGLSRLPLVVAQLLELEMPLDFGLVSRCGGGGDGCCRASCCSSAGRLFRFCFFVTFVKLLRFSADL